MTKDKALFILDEMPEWNNDLRYSEEEYKEVIELCKSFLSFLERDKGTDLISREEAKAKYKEQITSNLIDKKRNIDFSEYAEIHCKRFNEFIDSIPSAIPEREKGHWIPVYGKNGKTIMSYKCSKCQFHPKHAIITDFCGGCGADMREVSE